MVSYQIANNGNIWAVTVTSPCLAITRHSTLWSMNNLEKSTVTLIKILNHSKMFPNALDDAGLKWRHARSNSNLLCYVRENSSIFAVALVRVGSYQCRDRDLGSEGRSGGNLLAENLNKMADQRAGFRRPLDSNKLTPCRPSFH